MTKTAQTSKPLPLIGQRPLSAKEQVQRAQALACNLPEKNKPSCSGQVFFGVFFDGTGNNRDADLPIHKQSNVVRLWRVHLRNADELAIAPPVLWDKEYVPGVGTPFPEIGEKGSSKFGKAIASGGQPRIFWGLIQTINVMHRYVQGGKRLISLGEAGDFAKSQGDGDPNAALTALAKKVVELKNVLRGTKPTITQFNISVFGFSRGAAQARVFCNWFYRLCEKTGDGYSFAGVPVRIAFLGIFDTVAAVGATSLDVFKDEIAAGHAGWAKGNLAIHPAIERCVHFVASHEVRSCFPLDSVRLNGSYPANCVEITYPGVHSNVGGGYKPLTQGRSPLPRDANTYSFCAIAPAIDMHKEALASGVPLRALAQMNKEETRDFTASPQAAADYNAFINADSASGSVEEICAQKMHRYRFYRYKKLTTFVDEASQQGAPAADVNFLRLTNRDFKEKCHEFKQKYRRIAEQIEREKMDRLRGVESNDRRTFAEKKEELLRKNFYPEDLAMWEGMHRVGTLPDAVTKFFDQYVHDSLAGFAQDGVHEYKFNGRGMFRQRTVYDKGGH